MRTLLTAAFLLAVAAMPTAAEAAPKKQTIRYEVVANVQPLPVQTLTKDLPMAPVKGTKCKTAATVRYFLTTDSSVSLMIACGRNKLHIKGKIRRDRSSVWGVLSGRGIWGGYRSRGVLGDKKYSHGTLTRRSDGHLIVKGTLIPEK